MSKKNKFLTCYEASLILNKTEGAVRTLAHRNGVPFYQLPRGIRFLETELKKYLKEKNRWDNFLNTKCGFQGFIKD